MKTATFFAGFLDPNEVFSSKELCERLLIAGLIDGSTKVIEGIQAHPIDVKVHLCQSWLKIMIA